MISGAPSFENLFLVNGVVVNENIRGQATNALHRGRGPGDHHLHRRISAEYGRFAGGVVNMLTKSGGNEFHGSFRESLRQRQVGRDDAR